MKRLKELFLFGLIFIPVTVWSIQRSGNGPQGSYLQDGDQINFLVVTLSSTSATTVSAYSQSRAHLFCHNTSPNLYVFVGSATTVTSGHGYQMEPSTAPISFFETRTTSEVDMIVQSGAASPGPASSVVITCQEEK